MRVYYRKIKYKERFISIIRLKCDHNIINMNVTSLFIVSILQSLSYSYNNHLLKV